MQVSLLCRPVCLRHFVGAVPSQAGLSQLVASGDARASQLVDYGVARGWTHTQSLNGPIRFVDQNGVVRLTIKSGSARAIGSNFPHVELRNADGIRVDGFGQPVSRREILNHAPIVWDLA